MDTQNPAVIPPPPGFNAQTGAFDNVPPPPTTPAMGSMGIPADIQARVENPFGKTLGALSIPGVGHPLQPGSAPAGLAVPGAGSLLGRVGLQGLAGGAEALAQGSGPVQAAKSAAGGLAGGLVGEGAGKAATSLASPLLKKVSDTKVAGQLTDYLKDKVPAWAGMKNLGQMLYSQRGYNRLHEAYDESLAKVVKEGTGKELVLPEDVAKKLGVEVKGLVASKASPAGMPNSVAVDAGKLAEAMTGKWKGGGGAYRVAARALDDAGIGDPAARGAYKTAMGMREYIDKSKALGKSGRDFDLMAAQNKLGDKKAVDELLRRDMGQDVIDMILPEGTKAITKGTQKVPGAVAGTAMGLLGGHGAGMIPAGLGGAGGEFIGQRLGGMLPKYSNLPATPQAALIKALLSRLGGAAGSNVPK